MLYDLKGDGMCEEMVSKNREQMEPSNVTNYRIQLTALYRLIDVFQALKCKTVEVVPQSVVKCGHTNTVGHTVVITYSSVGALLICRTCYHMKMMEVSGR